ncbi:MAG: ribosome recycling factor [Gammaproteobacteria bacterium]
MIDDIKTDAEKRMKKSIEMLESAFSKVRTGRAHPSILDGINVKYYGQAVPLKQVAQITVEDGRTLLIKPFERGTSQDIERAIHASDIGLNPSSNGEVIRLPTPPLTEDRRRDLIKVVRGEAENARVALRNVRRDANQMVKDLLKEKEISEDDARQGEEQIQKLTNHYVDRVAELLEKKEKDLMEF